jgi:hypothetical protein
VATPLAILGTFDTSSFSLVGEFDTSSIELLAEIDDPTYLVTDVVGPDYVIDDTGRRIEII